MTDEFKQPILGIMTYKSGLAAEHSFGVLFDGAAGADRTHVRIINYAGLPTPPCTELINQSMPADSGMFMAITPQSANHLVQQVETLKTELNATPPIKRYFYASRVAGSVQVAKPAGHEQRFAHSLPTNCAHFIIQAAQRAGVDIIAVSPDLLQADGVEDIAQVIDKAMAEPGNHPFRQGAANGGQPLLYFQSAQEQPLLQVLQEIPPEALSALSEAPPLTRTHLSRLGSTTQVSSSISM